jgi:hypothetical protein
MAFFQRIGSATYHTTEACSKVPKNVKVNKEWRAPKSRPKGKKCAECENKTRKPVKKKVAKKKAAAKKTAKKKPAAKKKVAKKK